jgi:hypothetical protein
MRHPLNYVRSTVAVLFSATLTTLTLVQSASAGGADYDGNGFAEIPVLTPNTKSTLNWKLFDPASGKTTTFASIFGHLGDGLTIANWLYPKVTSAGVVSAPSLHSGGRLVWTIRTNIVRKTRTKKSIAQVQHTKYLGRPGDIIMTGGDFDGDTIADAVVITNRGSGSFKWGLRGNFFMSSYNPGLNQNRAYFDFGTIGSDKPFFFNPDGTSDWFAVLRASNDGNYDVVLTQPFTREVRSFPVGAIPDGSIVPVPVQQDDGSDYLAFWGSSNGRTSIIVKDLTGRTVNSFLIPLVGDVTVGNYGAGPGEEIAVSSHGRFFIINPITGSTRDIRGPAGIAADSININSIR